MQVVPLKMKDMRLMLARIALLHGRHTGHRTPTDPYHYLHAVSTIVSNRTSKLRCSTAGISVLRVAIARSLETRSAKPRRALHTLPRNSEARLADALRLEERIRGQRHYGSNMLRDGSPNCRDFVTCNVVVISVLAGLQMLTPRLEMPLE